MPVSSRLTLTLAAAVAAIELLCVTAYTQTGTERTARTPNADIVDPAKSPLPNPNPTVVKGFGPLPDGRMWGSTAGVDIGPDGNIWAYDRCGTNRCLESNLAPILKFDRVSGKVLANFGGGMIVFPHGLYVDRGGRTDLPSRRRRRTDQVRQAIDSVLGRQARLGGRIRKTSDPLPKKR